jgi:lipoprotein-anchoring transpeptidase ErfK/SrfK
MQRRIFLTTMLGALTLAAGSADAARRRGWRRLIDLEYEDGYPPDDYEDEYYDRTIELREEDEEEPVYRPRRRRRQPRAERRAPKQGGYRGKSIVAFRSGEKRGTIVIRTGERALYYVLGGGKAIRYGVAVGKEGFQWSGTARIGHKVVNPSWTPPAEMIERKPELEEWAGGMPGGIPENPLGVRALYLYRGKRDTLFRIHGTNQPGSIGTAASSGCIRMLNAEVVDLYGRAPVGTKVIVQ